jgi:HD superfamily phosphodiesterase
VSGGGWWSAKVRRFVRYFTGRVSDAERRSLSHWLTPDQLALFDSMHRADQRHGLDVVRTLEADGRADADLLLAGLLHDCGKGRDLRLWHRIGWSLAERYGSRVERLMLVLPTFGRAFKTMDEHAQSSAELALAAGANAATADLIRHQAEPLDDERGRALLLADQAN